MNINIYKNLYTNVYKPNGSETTFTGDWQHQALTSEVGSIFSTPYFGSMVVKPATANNLKPNRRKNMLKIKEITKEDGDYYIEYINSNKDLLTYSGSAEDILFDLLTEIVKEKNDK
jgi:hypothetical protein